MRHFLIPREVTCSFKSEQISSCGMFSEIELKTLTWTKVEKKYVDQANVKTGHAGVFKRQSKYIFQHVARQCKTNRGCYV